MASIYKKRGKWSALIRRSFHKPIHKSFISKQDAQRWARETERLIEMGELIDTSEANKTSLKQAAMKLRFISEEDFDRMIEPKAMIHPKS